MAYKVEKVLPKEGSEQSKTEQVEQMFDEIAPVYDQLNHTLSINLDKGWRRKAVDSLKDIKPKQILDIATGTGDLAVEICRRLSPERVLAVDLSEKMMAVGRDKVERLGLSHTVHFQKEDSCRLTLADNSFDAITIAFGIRNFESLDRGLQEMLRVLRPGGRLMILELSTPERFPVKQGYKIYSKLIPLFSRLIGIKSSAYRYLPKSIEAFPQNEKLTEIMRKNGFKNVSFKLFSLGICTMYTGEK